MVTATQNACALLIGIARYDELRELPQTVLKDARDISNILRSETMGGYPADSVTLLVDSEATRSAIQLQLASLAQRTDESSTVFIYVSSHGGRIESGPNAGEYLLPVDAKLDLSFSPPQLVAETAISSAEIAEALRHIPARKMVVVFDCCHSGGIGQPKDPVEPEFKTGLSESYYTKLAQGRGRVILASSRSTEYSYVMPGAENSLFTQHLLAGLRGGAIGAGGVIRIFDLFNYLQPRVTADQPSQHPIFKAEVEDNFPVALYLGGKAPTPAVAPLTDSYAYDVFLSYRNQEPDKSWVRSTLVPRLEADGLRVCVDYKCFRLGRPLVLEMERAVQESRYTLAVLSPPYLESNFTELEGVLAQHLGLEKSQYRFLAALHQECTPRLGIRANLMLDMTQDSEFEINVDRLIFELRRPSEK